MLEFDFDFESIVQHAKDIVIVTKALPIDCPGPEIVYVNRAFTNLTGYTSEEVIGRSPRFLQSADNNDEKVRAKIREALQQQVPVSVMIKNYSKTGREYWLDMNIIPLKNPEGEVKYFAAIERDVTAQKIVEQQLDILAKTDALTGLLNRKALEERLMGEYSRYSRTGLLYCVLILDINAFSSINTRYGYASGDLLLKCVAQCGLSLTRLHDTVARIGGDEFCVILPGADTESAYIVAEKIRVSVLGASKEVVGEVVSIRMGIAQVEITDYTFSDTLKRAQINLYKAKQKN